MSVSPILLLPAIAAIIVMQGSLVTIRGNLLYRSRRARRRIKARVFFYRALVAALLLATVITRLWPLEDLHELLQGLMLTGLMMLPVALYVLLQRRKASRESDRNVEEQHQTDTTDSAPPDLTPVSLAEARVNNQNNSHAAEQQPSSEQYVDRAAGSSQPSTDESHDEPTDSVPTLQVNANTAEHRSAARPASLLSREPDELEEDAMDQTLSVSEQLESLDNLVNFHDIGDEKYTSEGGESTHPSELFNPLENAIAVARKGILEEPGAQEQANENLPARSSAELANMVVNLRSDKMKLQKLVIAQKAVIDAEKQAHERTRVVVKDAISVMRHARHGQRIAEKIARRERAERQRLEKDVDKLRKQMSNALSTIDRGEDSRIESEAS